MAQNLEQDLQKLVKDLKDYLANTVKNLPQPPLGNVYREDYIKHRQRDIFSFEAAIDTVVKTHGQITPMYQTVIDGFTKNAKEIKAEIDRIP